MSATKHRDPGAARAIDEERERLTPRDGRDPPDGRSVAIAAGAKLVLQRQGVDPEAATQEQFLAACRQVDEALGGDGPEGEHESVKLDLRARAILKEQGKTFAQATQAEYLSALQEAQSEAVSV